MQSDPVDRSQAASMALEMLAETAWRKMFESTQAFGGSGIQGQIQSDWLSQALAHELGAAAPQAGGGGHGD